MYTGAVAPDFSNQVHDFDPGITKKGLFWTTAIDSDGITAHLDAGRARMRDEDVSVLDYFNIPNALTDGAATGPPVAASVSFDVRWRNPYDHYRVRDFDQDFAGEFWLSDATINWSGENDNGDSFTSSPEGQTVVFAQFGTERNGKYA